MSSSSSCRPSGKRTSATSPSLSLPNLFCETIAVGRNSRKIYIKQEKAVGYYPQKKKSKIIIIMKKMNETNNFGINIPQPIPTAVYFFLD
jgi:hypothetical protein